MNESTTIKELSTGDETFGCDFKNRFFSIFIDFY